MITGLDRTQEDLLQSVEVFIRHQGGLLTVGEGEVLTDFKALPDDCRRLWCALFRRKALVWLPEKLDYYPEDKQNALLSVLSQRGFIWQSPGFLSPALRLDLLVVKELLELCKVLGLIKKGKRAELISRLAAHPNIEGHLAEDVFVLRHKELLRRALAFNLCDHHGDLSKLVITRMGSIRFVPYQPSQSAALHPSRSAYRSYRQARKMLYKTEDENLPHKKELILNKLSSLRKPEDWRWRFSAWRYWIALALRCAAFMQKEKNYESAVLIYEALAKKIAPAQGAYLHRWILCLGHAGRSKEAVALCRRYQSTLPLDQLLSVHRSARRLAKKSSLSLLPLPPIHRPVIRELRLKKAASGSHRSLFIGPDGPKLVEQAVVDTIEAQGRRCFFGENAPWRSLFSLLFVDVIFASLPHVLPSPMLSHPLDFGSPGFAERRAALAEPVFARIEAGEAGTMLAEKAQLEGCQIAGINWSRFSTEQLGEIACSLSPMLLSQIMRLWFFHRQDVRKGMPDLCILPGNDPKNNIRIRGLFPGKLPATFMFVEIKGPGDQLSDAQKSWLHRLHTLSIQAEVWKICAS